MLARTCLALALAAAVALPALAEEAKKSPTPKELLAKSTPADWRTPDPQNLVYMICRKAASSLSWRRTGPRNTPPTSVR